MRPTIPRLGLGLLIVLGPGCGDDSTNGTGGASSTTVASSSTSSTGPSGSGNASSSGAPNTSSSGGGATQGADTTAGTTAATGSGTTEPTTGSSSGGMGSSSGGPMGSLEGIMSSLMIFQNCQPIVGPDPANVTFTLELLNPGAVAASATVVDAVFLDAGGGQVGTIDVMPNAFGPVGPGDNTMQAVTKVPGSLMPANGCGVLLCNNSYTLELTLDVDGGELVVQDTATADCVF